MLDCPHNRARLYPRAHQGRTGRHHGPRPERRAQATADARAGAGRQGPPSGRPVGEGDRPAPRERQAGLTPDGLPGPGNARDLADTAPGAEVLHEPGLGLGITPGITARWCVTPMVTTSRPCATPSGGVHPARAPLAPATGAYPVGNPATGCGAGVLGGPVFGYVQLSGRRTGVSRGRRPPGQAQPCGWFACAVSAPVPAGISWPEPVCRFQRQALARLLATGRRRAWRRRGPRGEINGPDVAPGKPAADRGNGGTNVGLNERSRAWPPGSGGGHCSCERWRMKAASISITAGWSLAESRATRSSA